MSHFSSPRRRPARRTHCPCPASPNNSARPTYVYSKAALLENFAPSPTPAQGRDALVCYAMKANSNLAMLNLLARQGAGFDIVSGGELLRVIAAGGDPGKVIFSGVGKTETKCAWR